MLRLWGNRGLDSLAQRVPVLERFIMSKAWYIGHLLPLATEATGPPPLLALATRFRPNVADFLWHGRLRRWHLMSFTPRSRRAALASPAYRHGPSQCWPNRHATASRGQTALHLGYWLGTILANLISAVISAGHMLPGHPSVQYSSLLNLLREVFSLDCITTADLQEAKSAKFYKKLTVTLPTLRIVRVQPNLSWDSIWPKLQYLASTQRQWTPTSHSFITSWMSRPLDTT
jgi:hypothetical protein